MVDGTCTCPCTMSLYLYIGPAVMTAGQGTSNDWCTGSLHITYIPCAMVGNALQESFASQHDAWNGNGPGSGVGVQNPTR